MGALCAVCGLLFLVFFSPSNGCHTTNIYVKEGTWCCGMYNQSYIRNTTQIEVVDDDDGYDGSEETIAPEETTTETMGNVTGETPAGETTEAPAQDLSECACGRTAPAVEGRAEGVVGTRPWLGRLSIIGPVGAKKNAQSYCSAVLITKKWFLSAAHCFCLAVTCSPDEPTVLKLDDGDEVLKKLQVSFGWGEDNKIEITDNIKELRIHPNYTGDLRSAYPNELNRRYTGNPDIGLAQTTKQVYVKGYGYHMLPICLNFGEEDEDNPYINDLDCEVIEGGQNISYPNIHGVKSNLSKLSCNPDQFMDGNDINYIEKRSHMTAYGDIKTSRQYDETFIDNVRCTTNSYGPPANILRYCSGSCTNEPNPSKSNELCKKAEEEGLFSPLSKPHFNLDDEGKFLNDGFHSVAWIKILNKGKQVMCYSGDPDAQSLDDFPYRHGWCKVKKDWDTDTPDGWGWCSSTCGSGNWSFDVHEEIVNTFISEDCVPGVKLWTADGEEGQQFCASSPVMEASGTVWELDDNGQFNFVQNELRHENPRHEIRVKGVEKDTKDRERNDNCFGDVGGAVWKYMAQNVNNKKEKLESLTGIISRFEVKCGAFRDQPEIRGDRQNIVLTRIRKIMPWLKSHVEEIKNCY